MNGEIQSLTGEPYFGFNLEPTPMHHTKSSKQYSTFVLLQRVRARRCARRRRQTAGQKQRKPVQENSAAKAIAQKETSLVNHDWRNCAVRVYWGLLRFQSFCCRTLWSVVFVDCYLRVFVCSVCFLAIPLCVAMGISCLCAEYEATRFSLAHRARDDSFLACAPSKRRLVSRLRTEHEAAQFPIHTLD